jgi:hypothetical protein
MNISLSDQIQIKRRVFPELESIFGKSFADFLAQADYWMERAKKTLDDGSRFFWKTYKQWEEELNLSVGTVRRAVSFFKELGIITVERLSKETWYQANWYSVNYDVLFSLIEEAQQTVKYVKHIEMIKAIASSCLLRSRLIIDSASKNSPHFFKRQEKMKTTDLDMEIEDYAPEPGITQEPVAVKNNPAAPLSKEEAVQQPEKPSVGLNVPAVRPDPFFSKKPRSQDLLWDWIPSGPWRTSEGNLDVDFINWRSNRWMREFGGLDIHSVRGHVRAYFKNDPTRLANDWQQYQEIMAHKFGNAALREQNDMKVEDEEKQQLIRHKGAFKANPHAITAPNTDEVERYAQWLEATAKPTAIEKGEEQSKLEAEREIDWDSLKDETDAWETDQIEQFTSQSANSPQSEIPSASIAPEGAFDVEAYLRRPKEEDVDFYRNLYEQREQQAKKQTQIPVESASQPDLNPLEVKRAVGDFIGESLAMKKLTAEEIRILKERDKQSRNVAHWNSCLLSGIASLIVETTRQARAAGYDVVDNQVVKID